MKFTLVFESKEAHDLTYALVFIPCPVWIQGKREILNLNPERPDYQPGSVRRLLQAEQIERDLAGRHCALIIHAIGHGSQDDLETLLADLQAEGFQVSQTRL